MEHRALVTVEEVRPSVGILCFSFLKAESTPTRGLEEGVQPTVFSPSPQISLSPYQPPVEEGISKVVDREGWRGGGGHSWLFAPAGFLADEN